MRYPATLFKFIAVLATATLFSARAAEPGVSIQNSQLQVSLAQGKWTIAERKTGKAFATATLEGASGQATVGKASDKTFGQGQAIDIADPNGGVRVMLVADLPFVLIQRRVTNTGAEPQVLNKIPVVSLAVDLGKPAEELTALGTGGLSTLGKNVGSYMWQVIADPQTRRGVVGGWISTDRGSGVVFAGADNHRAHLDAQVEYGRLRLAPKQTAELETFAVGYFDDARLGMEAWADALAKVYAIHLPPQPTVYCTWYHAGSSNETKLPEQAAFAAKQLAPFGFSVVQIDDGWQDGEKGNGPRKNFTRVRPGGPYASGMKATADKIRALGLVPGIWFMPFSGTFDDPWYKDHQDWFVKRDDGTPHVSKWGGTALDMTHPGALAYLRDEVRQMARDWGYGYFKMDGLCSGAAVNHVYVNDAYKNDKFGDAVLHNPDKTNIEAFRDGLRLIRDTVGKEIFLLGCCVPQNMRSYGGAFGLVDAMRIGPDNGANVKGILRGPTYGARNYHLHGRIWYNDPDPLYVRSSLPLESCRAICSWVTLSGQLNASSDSFADLPADRLDILKRTMPAHGLLPRPVDLFEENTPRIWLLTDARRPVRRDVLGLFNWDKNELTIDRPLAELGLPGATGYVGYEFWSNRLVGPFQGNLKLTLPPQGCAVLALRPVADHPQLISTSRHITQGIVDVLEETWNARAGVLSGVSKVVANDDYELRVVAGSNSAGKAIGVNLSAEDNLAGVTTSRKEDGGLVRVTIKSPASREVKWMIGFKKE
jgi:hypothetical protein